MRVLVLLILVASTARADVLRPGEQATELDTAVDANGKPFKLAALRGRWIVITIGAAWCDPCKAELPVWDRLAGETAGRAKFIALDIDNDVADGKMFHNRLGLANMVRVYMPEEKTAVAERYGAVKMPATFVIGPDGVVRYVQMGFEKTDAKHEYEKLRDALAKLAPKSVVKPPPKPNIKQPPDKQLAKPEPPKPLVATVPPLLWPDAPHAMWWADDWPALPL